MLTIAADSESEDESPRPAFPLPPSDALPLDHEGPPTTAEQYLAQVRREAAAMPDVFVSRLRPPSPPAPKSSTYRLLETPPHLLPDPKWQDELVQGFAALQNSVAQARSKGLNVADGIPVRGDMKGWRELVMGHVTAPALQFFLALDHRMAVEALRATDMVLDAHGFGDQESMKKLMPWTTTTAMTWTTNVLIFQNTLWFLFQLLALVVPPISGPTAAIIRSILRKITVGRLFCDPQNFKHHDDLGDMNWETDLAKVNVVVTILEKHFAQGDVPP